MRLSINLTFLSSTVLLALVAAPALAHQNPSSLGVEAVAMAPECATADKKMMMMMKSMASMPASGNMDKDFMAMSAANAKMMMAAAKMEMACSTNPEMRKMAEAAEKRNRELLQRLGGLATVPDDRLHQISAIVIT